MSAARWSRRAGVRDRCWRQDETGVWSGETMVLVNIGSIDRSLRRQPVSRNGSSSTPCGGVFFYRHLVVVVVFVTVVADVVTAAIVVVIAVVFVVIVSLLCTDTF